jgi:hypothetical protein
VRRERERGSSMPYLVFALIILAITFPVAPVLAQQQQGKVGYLARQYLTMPYAQKDAYTTGVVDAMDLLGFKCPDPPSYAQIMADTDTYIARNPNVREMWAATSIMLAMVQRGCTRQ